MYHTYLHNVVGRCADYYDYGSDIPFGTKLNLWLNLRIIDGHLR